MLVAVLVVGVDRNGSRAWFGIGTFTVQPSEAAKVALTLWGAHVLAARRAVMHRWKYALSPVVPVTAVLLTLLVLEPDLGMAVTLGLVLVALLFYAGAPLRLMAALCGGALVGGLLLATSASYRMSRVLAFLSPGVNTESAGFQSRQALYSLAGGGLFGQGLGQGSAKWDYLPNAHNDFIFAIIGEELGLIGTVSVILAFTLLLWRGVRASLRAPDSYGALLAGGITAWIGIQAFVNIGAVTGVIPTTGIPLPFISYGGTSLAMTLAGVGILCNVSAQGRRQGVTLRAHVDRRRGDGWPRDAGAGDGPGAAPR
jgi:cell division protein FtsW